MEARVAGDHSSGMLPESQQNEAKAAKRVEAKFAEAERLAELNAHQRDLYQKLSLLRRKFAVERSVPAYQIMTNRALIDFCLELPLSVDALNQFSGVGRRRLEAYGPHFVSVIRQEVLGEP